MNMLPWTPNLNVKQPTLLIAYILTFRSCFSL